MYLTSPSHASHSIGPIHVNNVPIPPSEGNLSGIYILDVGLCTVHSVSDVCLTIQAPVAQ